MSDADSDTGPDDPRFVVVCDDCEMGCRTDDPGDAISFAVKHQRHTGHSLTWERSRLANDIVEVPKQTRWRVHCEKCETTRVFRDRKAAERFCAEHEQYAGHAAPEPERIALADLDDFGPDDVETLLHYCFENADTVDVVPVGMVIEALSEAGVTPERASQELAVTESECDVYERGHGFLAQ